MRIAVLFGGTSEERDDSVASGAQVIQALENAGHEVIAIDTARGALAGVERAALSSAGVHSEPASRVTSRDLPSA